MNAPTSFALPDAEQYRRLFGLIPADQVITLVAPSFPLGGTDNLGPLHVLSRDPKEAAAGHPFFSALAEAGHPSAASLASIAALRLRHIDKGHTPEADAAHGWLYFKRMADEAYRAAVNARSPANRRERLIIAAAILIAQIDAEDFLAQQQEPTP